MTLTKSEATKALAELFRKVMDIQAEDHADPMSEQRSSGILMEHGHFCGYCGYWGHQGTTEDCGLGGGIYEQCPDCVDEDRSAW